MHTFSDIILNRKVLYHYHQHYCLVLYYFYHYHYCFLLFTCILSLSSHQTLDKNRLNGVVYNLYNMHSHSHTNIVVKPCIWKRNLHPLNGLRGF